MLTSIKERLGREDEGFTLIELMVVLLIIAILLAIAIPTFLGSRNTANARSMQENLRNALTAEQTYWTSNQTFTATTTDMQPLEPSLQWSTAAAAAQGGNTVTVTLGKNTVTGDTVVVQGWAKDGNCYVIEATNDASVTGSQNTAYAEYSGACVVPGSAPGFVAPTGTDHASQHVTAAGTFPTAFYNSF